MTNDATESRYEYVLAVLEDDEVLDRDLTRTERNQLRAMFGLGREVSETDRCA